MITVSLVHILQVFGYFAPPADRTPDVSVAAEQVRWDVGLLFEFLVLFELLLDPPCIGALLLYMGLSAPVLYSGLV